MASAIVLTDKATFQCAHMPKAIGTDQGITISLTASKTTVAGAKPILNGATIGGFTLAAAHGWEKRHFVARRKCRAPLTIFLIA